MADNVRQFPKRFDPAAEIELVLMPERDAAGVHVGFYGFPAPMGCNCLCRKVRDVTFASLDRENAYIVRPDRMTEEQVTEFLKERRVLKHGVQERETEEQAESVDAAGEDPAQGGAAKDEPGHDA